MNSAEPNYDTSSETKMENYDLGDHSIASETTILVL